jgi:uncharacterized membrane protein YjjP (DUF1212 family)
VHPDLFKDRVNFLLELAKQLHISGTSVNRLEGALERVARKFDLVVNIWSNPTGIMISFLDPIKGEPYTITRILRLKPGETNLGRLADADAIAEQVLAGEMNIQEGLIKLQTPDRHTGLANKYFRILCYGLASAMVVSLFPRTGFADLISSFGLGLFIGLLVQHSSTRAHVNDAYEAIAAFVVTLLASAIASFIAPLSLQPVIISALITLMPGLMLTLAMNELANQQLVSGTTRFAGALMVLMKLAFGSMIASGLILLLDLQFMPNLDSPVLPVWMPWFMVLPGSFALAVLFKTNKKDIPFAMAAVFLGFGLMKACSLVPVLVNGSLPMVAFLSALGITMASNLFAQKFNRPGALIRVPGIILLVPGSLGFTTFNVVFAKDISGSIDLAFSVIVALVALVAGILFGNLLVSSRRYL